MIEAIVPEVEAGAFAYPRERAKGCPFDPPLELKAVQESRPLTKITLWNGAVAWFVTSHELFKALMSDPRVSCDYSRAGFPHVNAGAQARFTRARTFMNMDAPDHTRFRKMVTAPFAVKRVQALRERIQEITDGLIDDMLAGPKPVDLVEAFALPLPSMMISDLLGVPYDEHAFFQRTTATMVSRSSTPEAIVGAIDELTDYLEGLVKRKETEPDDAVLSALVREYVAVGELSHRQAAELGVLLLVAGHETTANMVALGTAALLANPDQLKIVRETDDPAVFASTAEEMLRYLTITHWSRRRVAIEDIEIAGEVIRAGQGIVLSADMANRDPAVFEDPDKLDVLREARRHVAFGFGPHQCLGQALARVELQVIYGTLYRRVPTLRLAIPMDEVDFKFDGVIYGTYELPVTWDD